MSCVIGFQFGIPITRAELSALIVATTLRGGRVLVWLPVSDVCAGCGTAGVVVGYDLHGVGCLDSYIACPVCDHVSVERAVYEEVIS